ncbi:MAG: glycoside hydrolase family 13 protein [Actinobacteria bacterium]|nr:glycoside hydrolase family 13 protein [Actinomycetota bacterium]
MTWWREAVFYQIYIRSFSDGNGDGLGDFPGILGKLDYLEWLGIDAIWVTPFYPSPMADHGYDVSDYKAVDPVFGTLGDVDALLEQAHARGIKVIFDIVPNHTSDQHPWFQNAIRARSDPDRDKYIFRAPDADGGPPNNWRSVFGGPAWTFHEPTGEYFLHLFAPEQPDLNWRNPEVHEYFDGIIRFWLDLGADGFRIDVAHALYKDEMLRSQPEIRRVPGTQYQALEGTYAWDQPEVHDVYRRWRKIGDSYPGDRVFVGEVFILDPATVAKYTRPDELHLAFNFFLVAQPWDPSRMKHAISLSMEEMRLVENKPTWVLSNHDVVRHVTRFGGGDLGRRRARAALLMMMALPGAKFIYQGEELGLEQVEIPDALKQDPVFFRTNGKKPGRDGCRVPLPWTESAPTFGFTAGEPWLPIPPEWGPLSVAAQKDDSESMLAFYKEALLASKANSESIRGGFEWLEGPEQCVIFKRSGSHSLVCVCNFGSQAITLPLSGEIMVASEGEGARKVGSAVELDGNCAVWLRA